jgi:predicted TIM-barrel fold metal-dependent hydrolase
MYEGPLIDCHSHVFPDTTLRDAFTGQFSALSIDEGSGLLPDALDYLATSGVEHLNILLLHCSGYRYFAETKDLRHDRNTKAPEVGIFVEQRRRELVAETIAYNEWGVRTCQEHDQLSCFVTLNPVLMEPDTLWAELEDKVRKGAKGVKLAAFDYQAPLDDRRHWPIYDFCQRAGVPILLAPGLYCSYQARPEVFGHPLQLIDVVRAFPRLKVCLAHLGHGANGIRDFYVLAEIMKLYPWLFADLSGTMARQIDGGTYTAEDLAERVRSIGSHRILFGTNYGTARMADTLRDVEVFRQLPLTPEEFEHIAGQTFLRMIDQG